MRKISKLATVGVLAGACATVGALGGIAVSPAASTTTKHATALGPGGPPGGQFGFGGGPAVHSVSVVPDKAGTAFDTVTTDNGTVQSVDTTTDTATLVEGTRSVTYKTLTLTIPADATITRDFKPAKLSDLASGDHVSVSVSSGGTTTVFAMDSTFRPPPPPGHSIGAPPAGFAGGSNGAPAPPSS